VTNDRPIFVVGFSRSGTTLLQSLMGAHPRIAAPPELFYFRRIVRFRDYWGDLNDDAVLRRVVEETLALPNLADSGFDVERTYERARLGPRTYAGIFDAVMADYTEHQGRQRWSEKSPHQRVTWIWMFTPTAQVVHIVRDPRPTIASNMAKLAGYPDLLSTVDAWREFTLETIRDGAERGTPDNYLRIRYEDLAADPPQVMKTVFTFLGEDFDPAYVDDPSRRGASVGSDRAIWQARVLEPIVAADQEGWRESLSRPARLRLEAAVADVVPELGYAPASGATVAAGRVLNIPFRGVVAARAALERLRARRLSTPEQRFREAQSEHRKRGERMRRSLRRSSRRTR
jgi:hypothetical protein